MADSSLAIVIRARDECSHVLRGVGHEADGLGARLGSLGSVAIAGAAVAGVAAIGAGLVSSVQAATEFEASLSAIQAVSGATGEEMEKISALALQLGADTSFSAKEAAEGIGELVKGGVALDDIMSGGASAALNLAAAGGVAVAESSALAANAMALFNLKGSETANVADKIAGFANATTGSVSDFKFALSAVGAVAKLAGQDFDQTAIAIGLLGQAGILGSDAGTSLKTFLNNLIPTSATAKAAFIDLGLATGDLGNAFLNADGSFKDLSEIAAILNVATKDLSESERILALETIFGSDAIRAAAILAEAGADGWDAMATAMGNVTAAEVAAVRMDNLKGAMEGLNGSIDTVKIILGTAFIPVLRELVDAAIPIVNAFGETLPGVIATAKAAFTAAGEEFSAVSGALLVQGAGVVAWFSENWPTIETVVGQVMAQVTELSGLVVTWFQENWPLIQATIETVLGTIKQILTDDLTTIKTAWESDWGGMATILTAAWEVLKVIVGTEFEILGGAVKLGMQLITGDWDGAWLTFQSIVTSAWNGVQGVVATGVNAVIALINKLLQAWNSIQLQLPSVELPGGGTFGGGSLGVPQIPLLPSLPGPVPIGPPAQPPVGASVGAGGPNIHNYFQGPVYPGGSQEVAESILDTAMERGLDTSYVTGGA